MSRIEAFHGPAFGSNLFANFFRVQVGRHKSEARHRRIAWCDSNEYCRRQTLIGFRGCSRQIFDASFG